MSYHEKVVGLGIPLVDIKFQRDAVGDELPLDDDEFLLRFVNYHINTAENTVGGIVPNILTAYARFGNQSSAHLVGCIGDDNRGELYSSKYDKSLGRLQISQGEPTGFVAIVLEKDGTTYKSKSFDGASQRVKAPENDMFDRSKMFITSANTLRLPQVVEQIEFSLHEVKRTSGVFVLCLGGARTSKTTREVLWQALSSFPSDPDLLFCNAQEIQYVSGYSDIEQAIENSFPNSRLAVVTQDKFGAIIRFEGEYAIIPVASLAGPIIDKQGAGDAFMGVMLAVLNQEEYSKWSFAKVKEAAHIAAYASSLVIQSIESQLQFDQVKEVHRYYKNKEWNK